MIDLSTLHYTCPAVTGHLRDLLCVLVGVYFGALLGAWHAHRRNRPSDSRSFSVEEF